MNIRNLTIEELERELIDFGYEKYRGKQLFTWLHKSIISNIDEATNISKSMRQVLTEKFDFTMPSIYKEYKSKLDDTKKYLILLNGEDIIESVLMKYNFGYSICISSQVGCNMGCKFCASTIGGMKRNLETYELLSQIYLIQKYNNIKVSNIVIMGSGEPLLNYDNIISFLKIINDENGQNIGMRNITLSTCGIVPYIEKLMDESIPINLALSLHAPNDDIRKRIMPIANKYRLSDILKSIERYYKKTNRRITFEYCLIKEINDSDKNAYELVQLFKDNFKNTHVDFNINIIPVNVVKENSFERPDTAAILNFKNILEKNNISVTIRRELGKDISGSCGQLRASVK